MSAGTRQPGQVCTSLSPVPLRQLRCDFTTRLTAVRDELAAPVFRGSGQAPALGEQIEEFGRETIVAGLHSLPG